MFQLMQSNIQPNSRLINYSSMQISLPLMFIMMSGRSQFCFAALRHEHKLLARLGQILLDYPVFGNWFWRVGLTSCRFYWPEVSPKDSSLKRFPMLKKFPPSLLNQLC